MSEADTAATVFDNKAFFRRQSTFTNWPLDKRLSVWIEIVRHTADKYDKYEYVGSDRPLELHIGSVLKHTLPHYSWAAADESLRTDLTYHMEFFHMPAWSRMMETLAHSNEHDVLHVAMEQLMAHALKSPRPPGFDGVQAPSLPEDFDYSPESHHITLASMVLTLTEIINEAREWKNAAQGYVCIENPLQETGPTSHVVKLYEQDLEDLKARVGPKMDGQIDFLAKIHSCVGI